MQEKLQHFVFGICQLYNSCLIKYKAKTKIDKFAAFQVGWLQSIHGRRISHKFWRSWWSRGHDSASWRGFLLHAWILWCKKWPIFHTIACHVFHHRQSRALTIKESQLDDAEAVTDVTAIFMKTVMMFCWGFVELSWITLEESPKFVHTQNFLNHLQTHSFGLVF